jgi:hypothetical protein
VTIDLYQELIFGEDLLPIVVLVRVILIHLKDTIFSLKLHQYTPSLPP